LPKLGEPLSFGDASEKSRWRSLEGDFQLLWACNTSHAAYDMHQCPGNILAGGRWKILVVQQMSRLQFLSLFTGALEAGTHINHPNVTMLDVDAFRLVPHGVPPPGVLSLDGERVPYGEVQVEVHQGMAQVFCL